jgi:hypothetical protein
VLLDLVNHPVFYLWSPRMSSSDEEVSSPQLGQSSSKDLAPVTPNESETLSLNLTISHQRMVRSTSVLEFSG